MPSVPLRPCASPGCSALVRSGGGARCVEHAQRVKAERARFSTDGRGRSIYTSARWRSFRDALLREFPFCGDRAPGAPDTTHSACRAAGLVRAATQVDHIVPMRGDFARLLDRTAVQSLCGACHGRKTAREVGYGGAH
jgi:5-methylcytosine-specific restriction enzyme A